MKIDPIQSRTNKGQNCPITQDDLETKARTFRELINPEKDKDASRYFIIDADTGREQDKDAMDSRYPIAPQQKNYISKEEKQYQKHLEETNCIKSEIENDTERTTEFINPNMLFIFQFSTEFKISDVSKISIEEKIKYTNETKYMSSSKEKYINDFKFSGIFSIYKNEKNETVSEQNLQDDVLSGVDSTIAEVSSPTQSISSVISARISWSDQSRLFFDDIASTIKTELAGSEPFIRGTSPILANQFCAVSGMTELRLQIHPGSFGKMTIRLQSGEDGMRIVIRTETRAAHARFVADHDELTQSLELQGIPVSQIILHGPGDPNTETSVFQTFQQDSFSFERKEKSGKRQLNKQDSNLEINTDDNKNSRTEGNYI